MTCPKPLLTWTNVTAPNQKDESGPLANSLTVIDPDPISDGTGRPCDRGAGRPRKREPRGAGPTVGTGGQGLNPLTTICDGWIQDTVAPSGTGRLSAEAES